MNSSPRDPARASLRADSDSLDGIDPRLLARRSSHKSQKPNHHSEQYGKAASRVVDSALFSLSDDPEIQSLEVIGSVLEGAVLTVWLQAPPLSWQQLTDLEARAQALTPALRSVLAGEFHRKRTPHVRLRLVPATNAE